MRLNNSGSAVKLPPGAEVLAINGRSAAEILQLLAERMPAEGGNQTLVNRMCEFFFPYLYYTYLDDSREFIVSYLNPSEQEPRVAVLSGVGHSALAMPVNHRSPSELNHISFTPDLAVLTIKSFNYYRDDERRRFREFIEKAFADIRQRRVASLILDLRDNGGGDPSCAESVFSHLIDRPAPYFSSDTPQYPDLTRPLAPAMNRFAGRLFVLINGGCFSSTGHLCALLKYHQRGFFVGEETGGSYACTDASQTTTLTRSKLRFRHSTTAFKAAVSGLPAGRGTTPDDLVAPTIDDEIQHRDAVMTRALERAGRPAANSS